MRWRCARVFSVAHAMSHPAAGGEPSVHDRVRTCDRGRAAPMRRFGGFESDGRLTDDAATIATVRAAGAQASLFASALTAMTAAPACS